MPAASGRIVSEFLQESTGSDLAPPQGLSNILRGSHRQSNNR
jgi:hypothetical protein